MANLAIKANADMIIGPPAQACGRLMVGSANGHSLLDENAPNKPRILRITSRAFKDGRECLRNRVWTNSFDVLRGQAHTSWSHELSDVAWDQQHPKGQDANDNDAQVLGAVLWVLFAGQHNHSTHGQNTAR